MLFQEYKTKDMVHNEMFLEYLKSMADFSRPVNAHLFYAQSANARAIAEGKKYIPKRIKFVFENLADLNETKVHTLENYNIYSIKSEYTQRSFAGFIRTDFVEVMKMLEDKHQSWTGKGGSIAVNKIDASAGDNVCSHTVVIKCEDKAIQKKLELMCLNMAKNFKTAAFAYEQLFLNQSFKLVKDDYLHGVRNLCDAYDMALTYHLKNHEFNGVKGILAELNTNPVTIRRFATEYQIFPALSAAKQPEHMDILTSTFIADISDLLCTIQHSLNSMCGVVSGFIDSYIESRIALV